MYLRYPRKPIKSTKSAREVTVDSYFQEVGLWRKMIPKDGCCLYRIASEMLLGSQITHEFIEAMYKQYCNSLLINADDRTSLIQYLSRLTKSDFYIFWSSSRVMKAFTHNNHQNKAVLCTVDDEHFDLVYPLHYVTSSALCQSLLYELLYDRVFNVNNSLKKAREMMKKENVVAGVVTGGGVAGGGVAAGVSNMPFMFNTDNFLPPQPLQHLPFEPLVLQQQRVAFPYKVAKSLAVEILRNVEYDAWLEMKKGKCSKSSDNNEVFPGDKCKVILKGHGEATFNAHIQEVASEDGGVVVFVEGLGEKHTVHKEAVTMLFKQPQDWKRRMKKKSVDSLNGEGFFKRYSRFNSVCPITRPAVEVDWNGVNTVVDDEEGLTGGEFTGVCDGNESVFYEVPQKVVMDEGVGKASDDCECLMHCSQLMQPSTPTSPSPPCPNNHFMLVPAPDAYLLNTHDNYPSPINIHAPLSLDPQASDLPDVSTSRYFYNLGVMTHKGWMMLQNQFLHPSPHYPQTSSLSTHPSTFSPHTTNPSINYPHDNLYIPPSTPDPIHQLLIPSSEFILLSNSFDHNGSYLGQGGYSGAGLSYFVSAPSTPTTPPYVQFAGPPTPTTSPYFQFAAPSLGFHV